MLRGYKVDDTDWEQREIACFHISSVQPLVSATTYFIWVKEQNIRLQYQELDERLIVKYVFRKSSVVCVWTELVQENM